MPSSPTTTSWRRLAGVSQSTSSMPVAPDGNRHQAEQEVLVVGVDPLGRLGEHALGSLTGDPAQDVDVVGGEVDVTPTSRILSGNGPGPPP